jgi:hypothetical protein
MTVTNISGALILDGWIHLIAKADSQLFLIRDIAIRM